MRSYLVGVLVALACMASAKGQESRPESAPASRPAMEAGQYFATGRTYKFRSTVLDEDREIIVSYPDTFGVERKGFAVLDLLDGPQAEGRRVAVDAAHRSNAGCRRPLRVERAACSDPPRRGRIDGERRMDSAIR